MLGVRLLPPPVPPLPLPPPCTVPLALPLAIAHLLPLVLPRAPMAVVSVAVPRAVRDRRVPLRVASGPRGPWRVMARCLLEGKRQRLRLVGHARTPGPT